ncbi:DUF1286 domain-containing protein [Sulfuracidifex metallicus]|uniref:Uncharacterized protein n=1 Tax=Sulfuracidifex metallicus DSM 6482 = JCM 9184 TaxID=523847 RepID=A0A6A9QKN7_SULME|nr:hypothetical protein [Sulfuracidifex metallicus DSM 6482 = JCM 9184]
MVWGLLPSIPFLLLGYFLGYYLWWLAVASVLVGPSHMFLDMFTEAGVYVKKGGKWRRYALAHFRYNNPLAKEKTILLGVREQGGVHAQVRCGGFRYRRGYGETPTRGSSS